MSDWQTFVLKVKVRHIKGTWKNWKKTYQPDIIYFQSFLGRASATNLGSVSCSHVEFRSFTKGPTTSRSWDFKKWRAAAPPHGEQLPHVTKGISEEWVCVCAIQKPSDDVTCSSRRLLRSLGGRYMNEYNFAPLKKTNEPLLSGSTANMLELLKALWSIWYF